MKQSEIKPGHWYDTKLGVGPCIDSAGRFPPSVRIHIVGPMPRGVISLAPRDVYREINDPTLKQEPAQEPESVTAPTKVASKAKPRRAKPTRE